MTFAAGPAPLERIYVLAPSRVRDAAIEITPLSAREAFADLIRHTFRLDATDRERLRREFDALGDTVAQVSIRRLVYPRAFAALPRVHAAILADLERNRALP